MNLKKVLVIALVGILAITSLIGCSKKEADVIKVDVVEEEDDDISENVDLLVAAAASLTDVLGELSELYKIIDPNTNLTFTFGSSGALQTQIEEGAPIDIFMSAAQKQMKALEDGNHIIEGTNKTLLINKVVLIVPSDSNLDITSFEDMTKDEVKKIAIGDPAGVPVGQYTEEILANLNILDNLNPKFTLGNDVRTVLTWVESGEVDCGIVYATDAFISDDIKIITEAPEGSHKEVSYPVAVVEGSKNIEASRAFLDFLSTDEAIDIFKKYGFSMK